MKKKRILILGGIVICLTACSKFLDIVPDKTATISQSFALREPARHFLFTCYSFIPHNIDRHSSPQVGFWGGELWGITAYKMPQYASFRYGAGKNSTVNPLLNYWDGRNGATGSLFIGIRDCNIFLKNIGKVPNMRETERRHWIGAVKFLKAYYMFRLVEQYGPIPLMKKNIPPSASINEMKNYYRQPIDSCFNYIVSLLNEAIPYLPKAIEDQSKLGQISAIIALSFKAKVLVFAASPFFNGNTDYAGFKNSKGVELFNQNYDNEKWKLAADACKTAIDACENAGKMLYVFSGRGIDVIHTDTIKTRMSIRQSVTAEDWNSELIWGAANNAVEQNLLYPLNMSPYHNSTGTINGNWGPSIEFASLFYTNHGVPIDEDKTWDYKDRFDLQIATTENQYNIASGYTTAKVNFNRGPRFYADLGFDGSTWFGQGRYNDDNLWVIEGKFKQKEGYSSPRRHNPTGYWVKKLINYHSQPTSNSSGKFYKYPEPRIRLAGLYLLYAEALNEYNNSPTKEEYDYINKVRLRAGLPTVQDAWSHYSKYPNKYKTKKGMREIIHRERILELAFEGKNFWDQRRWKTAENTFNKPISGWSIKEDSAEKYYQKRLLFQPHFTKRDYLDPIRQSSILDHSNFVQNPGW